MTTFGLSEGVGRRTRPRFYLIMSLFMTAIIVLGFSQTVPGDFSPKPGLPLVLHLHGAIFTLWLLIVLLQPALVAFGNVQLHRRVGLFASVVAFAMVAMGLTATVFSIRYHRVPSFFPVGIFLVMNSLGILVFGGLVAAGVWFRKRADWHKRFMLCATVSILGPGLGRFLPMSSFGPLAPLVMFGVIALIALAGPVYDLATRRRVHPAYAWGVGAIVISEVLIGPLAFSPPARALLHLIVGS